jgi:hypothetical protein
MRAYFHIQGLVGDGSNEDPFRPQGLDLKEIAGWACSYDPEDKESCFVLVQSDEKILATLSETKGIESLAKVADLRTDKATAVASVMTAMYDPKPIEGVKPDIAKWADSVSVRLDTWHETMVGDYRSGD